MHEAVWFITIFVLALCVALFALSFVPFFARWSAYRHSVLIRVDLPRHLERTVSERLMRGQRGGTISGFLFILGAAIIVNLGFVGHDTSINLWFIAGGAIAGVGVGVAIAAVTGRSTVPSNGPRVARSGAVAVSDYVAPLERVGAVVAVLLAIAVLVFGVVVGSDWSLFPTAVFAVLGAASLIVFEVAGRRIVDLSQPAGSTGELVWDDAIRASILRDLLHAPLALGAYSVVFGLVGIAQSTSNPDAITAANLTGLVSTGVLLVIAIYTRVASPQRYFVDRLWPNLRWSDTADVVTDAA